MDVGADGDLHGVASIRCRKGSACLPLSSPRWSSRRRRCCSCGRRSGTRWCRRSREPTSARPSWSGRTRFRSGQLWLYGARTVLELAVLVAAVRLAPKAGAPPRPDRRGDRGGDHAGEHRRRAAAARRLAPARQERRPGHAVAGAAGRSTWPRAPRSAASFAAPAARCSWSGCAASGATGGRPAPPPWPASRSSSPTSARSCSTRCSTSSRRCRPARRAPTCSTSPSAPGVEVGEVYEVDASRRTTAANAYVTGVGQHQAGRALRHAAEGLHARRDAARRRPRARPRALPRRPARPAVARAGRAVRDARGRPRCPSA